MSPDMFSKAKESLSWKADTVMASKADDYASPNDVLYHFKDVASHVGLSPLSVWYVFFHKHVAAVAKYIRSGRLSSETIESRFVDLLNYIYLGYALLMEEGNTHGSQL